MEGGNDGDGCETVRERMAVLLKNSNEKKRSCSFGAWAPSMNGDMALARVPKEVRLKNQYLTMRCFFSLEEQRHEDLSGVIFTLIARMLSSARLG